MTCHELAILWINVLAECKDPRYLDAFYKEAMDAVTNLYAEKKEAHS